MRMFKSLSRKRTHKRVQNNFINTGNSITVLIDNIFDNLIILFEGTDYFDTSREILGIVQIIYIKRLGPVYLPYSFDNQSDQLPLLVNRGRGLGVIFILNGTWSQGIY